MKLMRWIYRFGHFTAACNLVEQAEDERALADFNRWSLTRVWMAA